MTDDDDHLENRASGSQAVAPAAIENPPSLGAWLAQSQDHTGYSRLEWQESCSFHRDFNTPFTANTEFQLFEAIQSKKVYNATVEENVRDLDPEPFSIHRLRTAADFLDKRNFDAFIPRDILLGVSLQEAHSDPRDEIFPGSSLCAEIGILPVGVHAVSHFYAIGTVTGRRANELSVLLPQDAVTMSKGWSPAPIPEKNSVIVTHPTPILDVKVRATPSGTVFALRTSSIFTLLSFTRADEIRGSGDISNFRWEKPLHLGTECFAGNTVADFALNPFMIHERSHLAIIVDSIGGLWRTRIGAEAVAEFPFASPYAAVEQLRLGSETDGRSSFSRITWGMDENSAIVARQDAIRVFNLEDHHQDVTLFTLKDIKTKILDMAQPTRSYPAISHRVICTTEEVIWLDLDKPDVPAFRVKHYRDDDHTLSLHCGFRDGVSHTFLWSRKTSAMTVYTTPAVGPLQLLLPAYNITPPMPNMRRSGLASIHVPSRRLKNVFIPEALVLVESAADGAVYQREFTTGRMTTLTRELEHGRIQHKRLNADQPLSHLPLEDTKAFRLAHFFMLYNRLFASSPSLHRDLESPDCLERITSGAEAVSMDIPLEFLSTSRKVADGGDAGQPGKCLFTALQAIDGSAVSPKAVERELGRLSLEQEEDVFHTLSEHMLGIPETHLEDVPSVSKYLQEFYSCHRFGKIVQDETDDPDDSSAVAEAHRFACDQIAVDLRLSKDILSEEAPTAPAVGVEDSAMSAYDRIADLPEVEYGFFKPVRADGTVPTSDAARALLSEWTLGADPNVRQPFKNPYSQQVRDEMVANKQLKAFKTRIAEGVGVSASQPVSAFTRSARPPSAQAPAASQAPNLGDVQMQQRSEVQHTPLRARPPMAQSQTASETQQETPMPFTQMVAGAHGGRQVKKKKRTGGF